MHGRSTNVMMALLMTCGLGGAVSGDVELGERRRRIRPEPMAPRASSMMPSRRGTTSNSDHMVGAWSGDGVKPVQTRQMRRAAARAGKR